MTLLENHLNVSNIQYLGLILEPFIFMCYLLFVFLEASCAHEEFFSDR